MLELRNKLLLLGLEVEASLIPTFTLDPRLIGGVGGEQGISKGSKTGGFDVSLQFSGPDLFPTGRDMRAWLFNFRQATWKAGEWKGL